MEQVAESRFHSAGAGHQAAPGAGEDEHLALVGLLNSGVACFWMKQVFHGKGGRERKQPVPMSRTSSATSSTGRS
ncbi:MAG: hypothetical protein ACRDY5_01855 [Acidimicrobiales bacterium]